MSTDTAGPPHTLAFPDPPVLTVMPPNGCGGWRDEVGHWHRCATTGKVYAQGRCLRCYTRQRRVVKEAERATATAATLFVAPAAVVLPADFGAAPAPAVAAVEVAAPAPVAVEFYPPDDDTAGYAWTLFDAPPGVLADPTRALVTLGKDGDIRLNYAARQLLGNPTTIEVLHDERRRALALRGCDPGHAHARVLREDRTTRAAQIAARTLRRFLPWVPAETVRITPRLAGGLLILDLPR